MQAPMYCEDEVAMASKVTTGISVRLLYTIGVEVRGCLIRFFSHWLLAFILQYDVIVCGYPDREIRCVTWSTLKASTRMTTIEAQASLRLWLMPINNYYDV